MIILFLIIFCLFVVAHAWEHANDKSVEHIKATFTRICVGSYPVMANFILTQDWISTVLVAAMVMTLFWDIFDIMRNVFAGEHPFYIGGSASIDKWGRKHELPYYFLKLFLLVASIGSYFQYQYSFA